MEMIIKDKIAEKFAKIIYDINQIYKNIYVPKDFVKGYYYFSKGKVYSIYKEQLPQYVEGTIEKQKDETFNQIFNTTSFKIKGKEFFDFYKTGKEKINEVIISDNKIIFKKSINEITFENDLSDLESSIKALDYLKKDLFINPMMMNIKLDDKYTEKVLNEKNKVQRFILDIDKNEVYIDNNRDNDKNREFYVELSLSNKFINGIATKKLKSGISYTPIYFNFYTSNDTENLFLISVVVNNSLITLKQYFIVIDVAIQE